MCVEVCVCVCNFYITAVCHKYWPFMITDTLK